MRVRAPLKRGLGVALTPRRGDDAEEDMVKELQVGYDPELGDEADR